MIRVLRLIEYEYVSAQVAESDMLRWNVPANGAYGRAPHVKIRSAIITNLDFKVEDEDGDEH